MKQRILPLLLTGLLVCSCATTNKARSYKTIEPGVATFTNVDYEEKAVQYGKTVDGYENVTIVKGAELKGRNLVTIDLSDFADSEVDLNLSCDLKISDSTGKETDVIWIVNEPEANFPELIRSKIPSDQWFNFRGSRTVNLSGKRQLYISAAGIDKENLTIYLKNFSLRVTGDSIGKEKIIQKSWEDEPSLTEAYKDYFDYFGFATPLNGVLNNSSIYEGLEHQASCITMENEFKPDFIFAWQKPGKLTDFTAENGKTYQVPTNTPVFDNVNSILRIAKHLNLKLRGHVLVWHSQTPDWFFRENYGSAKEPFVDPETMNARMEWYIKSVLNYIQDWENKNNNGERMVITWDVVNEAASDGATQTQWLRTDSNWYKVYKSDEFIVNAFRYANKYAPKDVLLAYNDYSCSSVSKSGAICKIVDAIQAAPDARIDVVGMQTHVGMNTSIPAFETAIKKFTAKGVDVQITEMDIGQDGMSYNSEKLQQKYYDFFTMFIKNRKTSETNGVRGITLWGIIDERSWIYNSNGAKQHPLLFDGNYTCKPAFYGVLQAAEDAKQ